MNRLKRAMLIGAAITVLYAGAAVAACGRDHDTVPTDDPIHIETVVPTATPDLEDIVTVTPEATNTPKNTPNAEPEPTYEPPTPTATMIDTPAPEPTATLRPTAAPTLEFKLFEFICHGCTQEEHDKYLTIAQNDYHSLLETYGIDKNEARMVMDISDKGGIGYDFYFNGKKGDAGGIINKFISSPTHNKHEMAHAINHTLFPTYHLWFDEGLANYSAGLDINHPAVKRDQDQIKENPHKFWESKIDAYTFEGSSNTPTHLVGTIFFESLILDYGLTPENNRNAISNLADVYRSNGQEISRTNIQNAYETALGKDLSNVFDAIGLGNHIIWDAIMTAKPAGTDTPTGRDYIRVKKVLSEF